MTAPDEKAENIAAHWRNGYGSRITNKSFQVLIQEITAALIEAKRSALEEAASASDQWSKPQVVKLAAGEMSAQELRTAQAVAGGISAAIRALIPTRPDGAAEGESNG